MTKIQHMVSVRSGDRGRGRRREREVTTEEEWREGEWKRRAGSGDEGVFGGDRGGEPS